MHSHPDYVICINHYTLQERPEPHQNVDNLIASAFYFKLTGKCSLK